MKGRIDLVLPWISSFEELNAKLSLRCSYIVAFDTLFWAGQPKEEVLSVREVALLVSCGFAEKKLTPTRYLWLSYKDPLAEIILHSVEVQ